MTNMKRPEFLICKEEELYTLKQNSGNRKA